MPTEQDKRFAALAIEKMLAGQHFSVSAVRDAANLLGRTPGEKVLTKLRTLHCVNWDEIPADIMSALPSLINEALSGSPISVVDIPCLREGRNDLPVIEDLPIPPRHKRLGWRR